MRKPVGLILFAILFTVLSLPAVQQQEQPKEKKKPRKVWTEDDLKGLSGRINVVGTEAPPPAEPKAAPAQPLAPGFPWEELDDLTARRRDLERGLEIGQRQLDQINEELRATQDADEIDALLQRRVAQEEAIAQREEELAQVVARIAELEKQAKGRKRPAAPPRPERAPPAEGAEAGSEATPQPAEEPPAEEEPAEEEPPPPSAA